MRPILARRPSDYIAPVVLALACLTCWGRLVIQPGGLIADANRPGIDLARKHDSQLIGNDLTRLFLPRQVMVARQVAELGHPSAWDESGFGGRPSVGNPQAGLFYPAAWLAWRSGSPAALGWLTVAHLAWGGLGTFFLMRRLGCGVLACVVAAGCVQSSPFVVAQAYEGHLPHVWAAMWAPWTFLGALGLRDGDSRRGLLLPIGLAMSYLAGHPQEWYYLTLALLSWALFDVWSARGSKRDSARLAVCWAVPLALSLGLIAVSLTPEIAAGRWTLRSGRLSMRHAGHYHVEALNVLQLLGPRALGGPADYIGETNAWETLLSIGLVPLLLGLLSSAAPERFRRPLRGWACLLLVTVIFAGGRALGLFAALYEVVPGMDRFRVPSRSLFLASLAASVLAGFGIEAVLDGRWHRGRLARLGGRTQIVCGVLVLAGALVSVLVGGRFSGDASRWLGGLERLARDPVFWIAMVGSGLTLAMARFFPGRRRLAAGLLAVLALTELSANGLTWGRVSPASRFLGPDPIGRAIAEASKEVEGPFRIRAADTIYSDLRAFARGLDKTDSHDSFQIQHAADLYSCLYPIFRDEPPPLLALPMGEALAEYRRQVRQGVLDRMSVAFLVAPAESRDASWPVVAEGVSDGRAFVLHRNPTALPRAYVVPGVEPYSGNPVEALSAFRRFDARRAVLMTEDPLRGSNGARQAFRPAEWTSTDPDRPVLRVTTEAPGLLVVADTWMPGWTATVDGQPAPVLRGNHAQRVIPLPRPGSHEIRLSYVPPGLALGAVLSAGSLVVLLAWACRGPAASGPKQGKCAAPLRWETGTQAVSGPIGVDGIDPSIRPSRCASSGTTRP
ncbi:hypothetical protein EP7_001491 [Isosphaeraceae bacterium EP7]